MENRVLDFIQRRFLNDCHWTDGNCYYFAVILRDRFYPNADILYDVINGHFVTKINGIMYDWNGVVSDDGEHRYVRWDDFDRYDGLQRQRVENDCIL